ncbi:hypothetical protein DPEC_G00329490, partial [Dallia pectoralis]
MQNVNCRDSEGHQSTPPVYSASLLRQSTMLHFTAGYNCISVVQNFHTKDKRLRQSTPPVYYAPLHCW